MPDQDGNERGNEKNMPTADATRTDSGDVCRVAPVRQQRRPIHEKELHIAPMLNVSKREFRKLFAILSTKVVLWTDMIVDTTVAHSDKLEDVLEGDLDVPNVQVCQIGGNSPELCGESTRIVVEDFGYHEVNLNIDCPSDRVSLEREFGAVLMKQADTAFAVVQAMQKQAPPGIPISVKCRVGVDDWDSLEFVIAFVERLRPVCQNFYLHARTCILNGLMSAKQNRNIPPLNFPRVYEVCRRFPDCHFWINGGIRTLDHAMAISFGRIEQEEPTRVDVCHQVPCQSCQYPNGSCTAPPSPVPPSNLRGCMLGRAAMDNPAIFADADRYFYGLKQNPCRNRREVFEAYCQYLEELYPRRCCDEDERITWKLPVPDVRAKEGDYCSICRPIYRKDAIDNVETGPVDIVEETEVSIPSERSKIAPRLIGRALIPIRGMFYGLPKSKQFNHRLDVLARDVVTRACGPGYIIRRALQDIIPDYLVDQDFATTEDYSCYKFH